jgi:hypothetical protein
MKKLLLLLIMTQSFAVLAGTLINKRTDEHMSIKLLEDAEVLQVQTRLNFREIPLRWVRPSYYRQGVIRYAMPETVTNITNYDGVCGTGGQWRDMSSRERLVRIGEVLLLTPLTAVYDVATMPGRFYKDGQYKSDVKLIKKASEEEGQFKISNRRFKRIQTILHVSE